MFTAQIRYFSHPFLMGALFSTLSLSCGFRPAPSSSTPASSAVLSNGLVDSLAFRIVEESPNDPSVPDPQRDLDTLTELDEALLSGEQLLFLNNFHLPQKTQPKELFLVWPDELLGSPIQNATYSHRAFLNAKPVGGSGSGPTPAWHDSAHQRWYIPLSSLFNNGTYTADAVELSHLQEVHLDLVPQKGANQTFDLQFHILPPLPSISLKPVQFLGPQSSPATTSSTFLKTGWEVQREVLTNPTPKTLTLWIQAGSTLGKMKITTHLNQSHNLPSFFSFFNPTFQPSLQEEGSEGDAQIHSLLVIHQDGTQESHALNTGQWFPVSLYPSEDLTLSWLAGPTPSTPLCTVPGSTNAFFIRKPTPPPMGLPQGPFMGNPIQEQPWPLVPYQLSWNLASVALAGDWQREIRIAHPFVQQEFAVGVLPNGMASTRILNSELDSESIDSGKITSSVQTGSPLSNPSPHVCQGAFQ